MEEIAFGLFATSGKAEEEAVLLAKSLRHFGGNYRLAPMYIFEAPGQPFSKKNLALLSDLDINVHEIAIPESILAFPFAAKTLAAGVFENQAGSGHKQLIWMDRDSLIINDPEDLILPNGKLVGYRPVDHRLIGSLWNLPKDAFWESVYNHFNLSDERTFPMMTSVDRVEIRPYFNAGMLVVRPQAGLLQTWSEAMINSMNLPIFDKFYRENTLYQIFIHQVLLAVILCQCLEKDQFIQLPYKVNYPLHMHSQYPADLKVNNLNDLITCRHDGFFEDKDWEAGISINEPLSSWLKENIQPILTV